jgi:hypothetical protein
MILLEKFVNKKYFLIKKDLSLFLKKYFQAKNIFEKL